MDMIQRTDGFTGKQDWGKSSQGPQQKVEIFFNEDGSRTERIIYCQTNFIKESIFKDVNGDGIEDLYSVTCYSGSISGGPITSSYTFIDEDGDGYSDEYTRIEYDMYGREKSKTQIKEENINEALKRADTDVTHDAFNRKMENIYKGIFCY